MRKTILVLILVCLAIPGRGSIIESVESEGGWATSKENPDSMDYHLSGGFSALFGHFRATLRKQDEIYYPGWYIRTAETDFMTESWVEGGFSIPAVLFSGFSAEYKYSEAYDIDRQYLYKTIININDLGGQDLFKLRVTGQWTAWRNPEPMLGAALDLGGLRSTFQLQYDRGVNTEIFRANISITFKVDDDVAKYMKRVPYLEPYGILEIYNGDMKTEGGFKYRLKFK